VVSFLLQLRESKKEVFHNRHVFVLTGAHY